MNQRTFSCGYTHIFCFAALGLFSWLLCAQASASPEKRYKVMLATSSEVRDADRAIRDTLDEAQKILSAEDYAEILTIQNNWVRNEFDGNVKAYVESGLSEAEALAQEIGSHADSIGRAVDVLYLRRNGKGVEGVYEYRLEGKAPRQGIMLVRQVDSSYTVDIYVGTGNHTDNVQTCIFSGEGELKQERVLTVTDENEAPLTLNFKDKIATVQSSPAADALCKLGFTLAGKYSK